MQKSNEERLMAIIEEVFETRSDPNQLQVNEAQMLKLQHLHEGTLSEWRDASGPLIWVLLIPTTHTLMEAFLADRISETDILEQTQVTDTLDALYLCSAVALPEARQKGKTLEISLSAISRMVADFPIKTLFVWPFSEAGKSLATKLAVEVNLPILFKS